MNKKNSFKERGINGCELGNVVWFTRQGGSTRGLAGGVCSYVSSAANWHNL